MSVAVVNSVSGESRGYSSRSVTVSPTPQKDAYDHVVDYTDSTAGAWDLFYVIDHALCYARMLPSLSSEQNRLIGRVSEVISTIGLALSMPQLISDCNKMRNSFVSLCEAQNAPSADPMRQRKVVLTFKDAFLNALTLANTLTYIPSFLDHLRVRLFDPAHLRFVEGFYNVTSIILDGVDLVGEGYKLNEYYSMRPDGRSQPEKELLEEKKCLSWMYVATDVASVALSAIALGALVFGIAVEGLGVIAVGVLVLSSIWLTMKIVSYFYSQIVVDPHSKNISASVQVNHLIQV